MKHAVRTVALLIIASLATGPALAAYACSGPCAMQASGHECCMGTSPLHAGSMQQMPPMAGCSMNRGAMIAQACCDLQIAPVLQDPAKAQVLATADGKKLSCAITIAGRALIVPEAHERGSAAAGAIGLASERCVLFHVFRI